MPQLLTKPDGNKYSKTAGGETIWLSSEDGPYRFYQAWISVDDSEFANFAAAHILIYEEIDDLVTEHDQHPENRLGQRTLAKELTTIVHGEQAAASAAEASDLLFDPSADISAVSQSALEFISGEVPSTQTQTIQMGIIDCLVETGLCQSRKDAKRAITEGGIYVNGERVNEADSSLTADHLLHGKYILLRRGKKLWHLLTSG